MHPPASRDRRALAVVATFEALKGVLALIGASGLLLWVHASLHDAALRLLAHLHLNPASTYPHIFVDAATHLDNTNLTLLAAGAAGYAALRFAEAWGLYRHAAWAEVLAAVSGAIYVPFEVMNVIEDPGWHAWVLLVLNLAVVALMLRALLQRRVREVADLDVNPAGKC